MEIMNTTEAAKMAAKLRQSNVTYSQIGKMLAKEGYTSRKTGRPLTTAAVWSLVSQHNRGYAFANTVNRKAAGKMATKAAAVSAADGVAVERSNSWTILKAIKTSNEFTPDTRAKLIQLIVDDMLR